MDRKEILCRDICLQLSQVLESFVFHGNADAFNDYLMQETENLWALTNTQTKEYVAGRWIMYNHDGIVCTLETYDQKVQGQVEDSVVGHVSMSDELSAALNKWCKEKWIENL